MKKFLSVFLLLVLLTSVAYSQEVNLKWGKLSKDEIALQQTEIDTAAVAVVLFDKGSLRFFAGKPIL
jgi:hypothetical protein